MSVYGQFQTPFGLVAASLDDAGSLRRFIFLDSLSRDKSPRRDEVRDDDALAAVAAQVAGYFRGERQRFDLALAPEGSEFQQRVWAALLAIPFGETRSYGELAQTLGLEGGARAVGRANATNPIGLIIPCHRVIGADGSLTGYAGGLPLKRRLLLFEAERRSDQLLFS